MSANDKQVGGDHYKVGGEEHWDRVHRLGLDYFQAAITKYVERAHKKNGVQDLEKAAHYLEKYIEILAGGPANAALPIVADNSKVICPTCCHQFAAISVDDQQKYSKLLDIAENAMYKQMSEWSFPAEIRKFNLMYGLQVHDTPEPYSDDDGGPRERLLRFKEILQDELNEVDDIIKKLDGPPYSCDDMLTDVADWLGDLQVYAASEMARWGIPWAGTLKCIMTAQWSKLGADGNPIVKDGKVVKGPNYVAPEPMIKEMIHSMQGTTNPVHTFLAVGPMVTGAACGVLNASPAGQSDRIPRPIPMEFADKDMGPAYEDEIWQCEGFYGDGTRLYRHRKNRLLLRSDKLSSVYAWEAGNGHTIAGNPTVLVSPARAG